MTRNSAACCAVSRKRSPRSKSATRSTPPAPNEMTKAQTIGRHAGSGGDLAERQRQAEQRAGDEKQADGGVPETRSLRLACSAPDKALTAAYRQANAPDSYVGNAGSVAVLGEYRDRHEADAVLGEAFAPLPASPRHRCRAHRSRRNGSCALPRRTCRRHSRRSRGSSPTAPSSRPSPACCCSPMASAIFSRLRPVETAGAISAFCDLVEPQVGQSTRPRFFCVSKSSLLRNHASNSWSWSQVRRKADQDAALRRALPAGSRHRHAEFARVLQVGDLFARLRATAPCRSRQRSTPGSRAGFGEDSAPRVDDQRMAEGLAAVLVQTALRGGDHQGAVLDRAGALAGRASAPARSGG